MDDLLQEFIAETRETLDALSGEIVAWEADPSDRPRLDAIFRFVHTVKGSCGFLDLPRLARLSHSAEDVLAAVRDGSRMPDTALVNAVLAIVDRIGDIVEAISSGAALDDSGEDALIAALAAGAASTAIPTVATPSAPRGAQRSVRLSVDLLDRMMSGMSDMVLARNELARRLRDDVIDPAAEAALERLTNTVAEMRVTVTRTRMQKIETLFSMLPRMVRDTATALDKAVALDLDGADVELDRELIETIRDPLVHLVRNAIDHGIEAPADRARAGKRTTGTLAVTARQAGNQIAIEIVDDGRGIDLARLCERAVATGIVTEADLRRMDERERLDLIFAPGLSVRETATAISGRGVGMDVVRANLEQIGGRVELCNAPGLGLTITLRVPLTLSILPTIVVTAGGQRFAIPRQAVEEIVACQGQQVRCDRLGDTAIATLRDRRLPLLHLSEELGLASAGDGGMLVIVNVPGGAYALHVDEVLDSEELVIKPAAPPIMGCGVYAGQTLPDSGQPMLLLDGAAIAARAGLVFGRRLEEVVDEAATPSADTLPVLLVVDLDGARRLVPLPLVERIEQVDAHAISMAAGRLHWSSAAGLRPAYACDAIPHGTVTLLHLGRGNRQLGYVIREAVDILAMPDAFMPALQPGLIGGVTSIGDERFELIDIQWLLAEHGSARHAGDDRVCLITGDEADRHASFLRPLLASGGYRVVTALLPGQMPDLVLASDDIPVQAFGTAPVVRIADGAAEPSGRVDMWDRSAIMAAIAAGGSR